MAQTPEEALPPYFGISPDEALRDLGGTVGTGDFAEMATLCAKGRDDLARRGHAAEGGKRLRPFSTWEITKYLIPVAPAHFRRVVRANPALPQGRAETQGGARWFSLDDCYYATCAAPGGRVVWSTGAGDDRFAPTADAAVCSGAPPPYGDAWRDAGRRPHRRGRHRQPAHPR